MRPVHSKLGSCIDCNLNRLTLPHSDAENIEILACILVINSLEIRNLPLARATPRSPEIYEDILALTYIVRELDICVLWLWRNAAGHSHNRIHSEIDERLAFCSIDSCLDCFLHTMYKLMLLKLRSKEVEKRIKL